MPYLFEEATVFYGVVQSFIKDIYTQVGYVGVHIVKTAPVDKKSEIYQMQMKVLLIKSLKRKIMIYKSLWQLFRPQKGNRCLKN